MPKWNTTGLNLECFPPVPEHVAQPWDAADELLVSYALPAFNTLLINDRYGALWCAFAQQSSLQSWLDSACAVQASNLNATLNQLPEKIDVVQQLSEVHMAQQVLIKVPKNFEQLQYWLQGLAQTLPESTTYYLAGMAKHWPVNWLQWLEQQASDYQQYPIQKKARLVRLKLAARKTPWVKEWQGYTSDQGLQFEALPGVFARERMDIGSRVLLQHVPTDLSGSLCDLGCGNGLLGLSLAKQFPITRLCLTDDSWVAVQSAQHNALKLGIDAEVVQGNSLADVTGTFDWIVCNPPFHDGHRQLTNIAQAMFRDSAARLNQDGKLLVIANRHLPYLGVLRALFAKVDSLGQDAKFSIYLAQRPKH